MTEGVEADTAKLVGTDSETIISHVELLLSNSKEYNKIVKTVNPYADGRASENIYKFILHQL